MESEYVGASHVSLGELISQLWGLEPTITYVCANHHKPTKILVKRSEETQRDQILDITAVAINLSHWVLGEHHEINTTILQRFQDRFALSPSQFESICSNFLTASVRAKATVAKLSTQKAA